MDTHLQIRMRIMHSLSSADPKYGRVVAELWDGDRFQDALEFAREGRHVITAAGYPRDLAGARQQAEDHWF